MKKQGLICIFLLLAAAHLSADTITSVSYFADTRFTGRGNKNVMIVGTQIVLSGKSIALNSITLNFEGLSDPKDVDEVHLYWSRDSLFPEKEILPTHFEQLASFSIANPDSSITIPLTGNLFTGKNYLFLTCHIAEKAKEGNFVTCQFVCLETATQRYIFPSNEMKVGREILLLRKLIYAPGDYGSNYYRIPAIIQAKNGTLVIATDKRKYSQSDLPQDIDIVINRSIDGGKTWSEPTTIAHGAGIGKGFGDAALCRSLDSAGLICVFVGGDGLWESVVVANKKMRSYMCRSFDNGNTWTKPIEITDAIYGESCRDAKRKNWKASFFGSGNGLQTASGRIMFAVAVRETTDYSLNNYVVYSDNNGQTWQVSERASVGGDEAKLVELGVDTILMSIRHAGARWYNISTDGGITWQDSVFFWQELNGNACNGDLIRYTSVKQKADKNRLLHSLPYDKNRKNVSLFMSDDEGKSWNFMKTLCAYGSAYSSLTVLPDGTIGMYVEENYDSDNFSIYFMNFSWEWLSNGKNACPLSK